MTKKTLPPESIPEAIAETPTSPDPITTDATEPPEEPENTPELQPITDGFCPNCNDKLRTGLNGEAICPLVYPQCPRHTA